MRRQRMFFKMVSLRNLKNTAKTLEALMVQYKLVAQTRGNPLSNQDIADIIAFLKLL